MKGSEITYGGIEVSTCNEQDYGGKKYIHIYTRMVSQITNAFDVKINLVFARIPFKLCIVDFKYPNTFH